MKHIFFGSGIGKKHSDILSRYVFNDEIIHYRHQDQAPKKMGWNDAAYICNPTYLHIKTATECIHAGIRKIFIEKPLTCNIEEIETFRKLCYDQNVIAYVAYPFRFHNVIKHIKKLAPEKFNIVCATHIKDWGKESYSFDGKLGGGALTELSHEIDTAFFIKNNFILNGKCGKIYHEALIKNAEHTYFYKDKDISIFGSLFSIVGEERYVKIDDKKYNYKITESCYREQMKYWLKCIDCGCVKMNGIDEASDICKQILKLREPKK